jgi:hypothetical protein
MADNFESSLRDFLLVVGMAALAGHTDQGEHLAQIIDMDALQDHFEARLGAMTEQDLYARVLGMVKTRFPEFVLEDASTS